MNMDTSHSNKLVCCYMDNGKAENLKIKKNKKPSCKDDTTVILHFLLFFFLIEQDMRKPTTKSKRKIVHLAPELGLVFYCRPVILVVTPEPKKAKMILVHDEPEVRNVIIGRV